MCDYLGAQICCRHTLGWERGLLPRAVAVFGAPGHSDDDEDGQDDDDDDNDDDGGGDGAKALWLAAGGVIMLS